MEWGGGDDVWEQLMIEWMLRRGFVNGGNLWRSWTWVV